MCVVQAYDNNFLDHGGEHSPSGPTRLRALKVHQVTSTMQVLLVQFGRHLSGIQTLSYIDKDATSLEKILQKCRLSLETLEVEIHPGMYIIHMILVP